MTEESFQECRKVMQKANTIRGYITVAKGNVAKWGNIESTYREQLRESQAEGAKKMLNAAVEKLEKWRKKFAELKFPESDIVKPINRCVECGRKIAEGNHYCGECLCEDDSDY